METITSQMSILLGCPAFMFMKIGLQNLQISLKSFLIYVSAHNKYNQAQRTKVIGPNPTYKEFLKLAVVPTHA